MESTSRVEDNSPIAEAGTMQHYGIVVFSHLRWDFVWQRPQQFLSRWAKYNPILFIEEPIYDLDHDQQPYMAYNVALPNVTVATPHLVVDSQGSPQEYATMRILAKRAIEEVNSQGAFDCPLLWYYSPMMAAWSIEYFKCRGIVYDCMDELSQFHGAPANLIKNEAKLLAAADVVFTGGFELWLKKQKSHDNVHFFGCGVEFDHFHSATSPSTEIPPDLARLPKPVLGWFGVIDERVDYDLLARMADLRPDWTFALVGPIVKVDPESLPRRENIHYLGPKEYRDLPAYCKGFNVCMMCFALNEATEYINPTKALEYLATGRPVISTPVRDVVRQYTDTVYIADNADEFIAIAEEALAHPDERRIRRGIEKARSCSWDNTVDRMRELVAEAVEGEEPVLA